MEEETYNKEQLDSRFRSLEEKNDAWSADIIKAIMESKKASEDRHVEQMERYDVLEEKIDPLLKIYDGAGFVKSFFTGAGSIVLSIGAIGAAILYFANWIRHG